jgi:hypothetical protein
MPGSSLFRSFFLQQITRDGIDGENDGSEGKYDGENRFAMQPLIQFISCKNKDQDDGQHLESDAGIPRIALKPAFLWVLVHFD